MSRVAAELRKKKTLAKEAEEVDLYNVEDDELQTLMNGIIGHDRIASITGHSDMAKVEHLAIVIDTNVQSIFNLCELLPNLKHLVLDNSVIGSVRDLGIGLRHITSLSLSSCGLNDLDGIGVLTGLQEICLSDNFITDVAPLAMHENLQTLNVTGNNLTDISMGDALSSCPKLKSLFLSRNPIARAPNYRIIMSSLISSLEMLDGTPVDYQTSRSRVTNGMILEAASALREMEEDLEDEARLEGDILDKVTLDESNIGTKKDTSNFNSNRFSNPTLISSPFKSSSRNNESRNNGNSMDTGSDLTHGSSIVLAGNMTAGMRKRRNKIAEDAAAGRDSSSNNLTLFDSDGDFESALDVLDSAMGTGTGAGQGYNPANDFPFSPTGKSPRASNAPYVFTQFMKEGDITSSVVAQNSSNGVKQRMHASSKHSDPNNSFLEVDCDDEDDNYAQPDRGGGFSSFSANSSPRANAISSRVTDSPSVSRKSRIESEDLLRASRADSMGRPKTAAKPGSAGSDRGVEPRQLNGSRPQSAMSTTSSNGSFSARSTHNSTSLLNSSFSVPFKVNHGGEFSRPSSVGSAMSSRRPSRGNSFSDFDIEECVATESTLVTKGIAGSPAAGYAPSFNKLPAVGKVAGSTTSIVHYDIVKRHHSSSDSAHSTPRGEVSSSSGTSGGEVTSSSRNETAEDEDSSSDTENISVTHAARRRLMTSSASTTNTSTTRARNQVLQQLFTTTSTDKSGAGSHPSSGSSTPNRQKKEVQGDGQKQKSSTTEPVSKKPPVKPSSTTISSKAGISLGFNLAGSLAAIDRWVSDMNSEEEGQDGDDSDEEEDAAQSSQPLTGSSRGERDLGEFTISSPTKGLMSSASNGGLRAHGAKDSRILSRDTIIDMCWQGNSRGTPSRRSANHSDSEEEEEESNGRPSGASTARRSANVNNKSAINTLTTAFKLDDEPAGLSRSANSTTTSNTTNRTKPTVPSFASPTASSSGAVTQPVRSKVSAPAAETAATPTKRRKEVTVDHTTLNDPSPPRYTSNLATSQQKQATGAGVSLSDAEIVELLRKPPKATAVLRTKGSFQDYFRGISGSRMKSLLSEAYCEVEDEAEREVKVNKRMDLLKEVIV